ncbi:MAG TPA: hypothetical protein VF427_04675 [Noviherbaspirillum sp.]
MALPLLKAKRQVIADESQPTNHIPHKCENMVFDINQLDGTQHWQSNFEAMCVRFGSEDLNMFFSLLDN